MLAVMGFSLKCLKKTDKWSRCIKCYVSTRNFIERTLFFKTRLQGREQYFFLGTARKCKLHLVNIEGKVVGGSEV